MAAIFTQRSYAQTYNTIITTEQLIVGIRGDSPWFDLLDEDDPTGYSGYCKDLAEGLAERLSANQLAPIRVRFITSTTQSRWDLVQSGTVHFECGPNTINAEREEDYGIKFSEPFFTTATQILLKEGQDLNTGNGIVGVITNTTNESDIKVMNDQIETDSLKYKIQNTFTNRQQGMTALVEGEINGFASDGTLLLSSVEMTENMSWEDYRLITPQKQEGSPFCADYGIILPGGDGDERWRKIVNDFIHNDRTAKRIRKKMVWGFNLPGEKISPLPRESPQGESPRYTSSI